MIMGGESLNYCSSTIDDQTAARSHAMSEPAAAAIIMGSETELVRIRGAQLCLIDGEESVLMQKGDFCLRLLKQEHSPLAAIVAAVGEVQWPVGKDAPVLKVWNRRYTFALPGLVYGLIFPAETTPLEVLQQLEAVMDRYCTFEVHREIAIAAQQQQQVSATSGAGGREESRDMSEEYWTVVAPGVETTSAKIARQICSTSSIVADNIVIGGEWASLGIQQAGSLVKRNVRSVERGVTPRMLKRMQQARRMSAVAKVMSRSLLKGAISATGHVLAGSLAGLDVNAAASVYDHITTAASDHHQHSSSSSSSGAAAAKASVAVASVDAFAKLVEAVETAGKSVYGMTGAVSTDLVQHSLGAAVGNVINTAWTLNKMGLRMLLQVTAASTAISTRKRTCSATRYSSTDHVQQQQQQLEYHQPSASATSTEYSAIMPPTSTNSSLLFRQITLSPQQHQQLEQLQEAAELAIPLNLLSAAASHNSADHHLKPMRTQTFLGPALTPAALHSAAATSSSSTPTSPAAAASKVYCNNSSLQRLNAHGHHPFVHPKSPFRHYTEQRQHLQPHSSPYNFSLHLDQSKAAP
ncbi:hypothetical protein CY35_02G062000 [Sphagnum magellanicum]|nr:hypothetical protein CY35_02G062000 [Sphagnum magellanicum]